MQDPYVGGFRLLHFTTHTHTHTNNKQPASTEIYIYLFINSKE